MAVACGASLLFSLACIAAEATGWFLAYNELDLGEAAGGGAAGSGLNLLGVNIGWDRYSVSLNGNRALTTRFLDDVSPAAYGLGILTFLLHLCSALASAAACLWLYHALVHGALPPALPLPHKQHPYARWISGTMLSLGGLLLATGVISFVYFVARDFHREFAPHLSGGFTVRPSWAFGLTILVCLASGLVGTLLARRATKLDRYVR